MNKNTLKKIFPVLLLLSALALISAGCSQSEDSQEGGQGSRGAVSDSQEDNLQEEPADIDGEGGSAATKLEVCFGDEGEPFVMHLEGNDTAAAIARHVGTENWRLPIYHYDDYENWEVMQYYDIPSQYEIPAASAAVTSEKAGEVYYSEPNRIILFYKDAEVTGEYTKVGYFDDTEAFREAVENNPELEGWSNKIVLINSADR